jgi:hypothetical protein
MLPLEEAKARLRSVLGKYEHWELLCRLRQVSTDGERVQIAQEILDGWPHTGSIAYALAASLQGSGASQFELPDYSPEHSSRLAADPPAYHIARALGQNTVASYGELVEEVFGQRGYLSRNRDAVRDTVARLGYWYKARQRLASLIGALDLSWPASVVLREQRLGAAEPSGGNGNPLGVVVDATGMRLVVLGMMRKRYRPVIQSHRDTDYSRDQGFGQAETDDTLLDNNENNQDVIDAAAALAAASGRVDLRMLELCDRRLLRGLATALANSCRNRAVVCQLFDSSDSAIRGFVSAVNDLAGSCCVAARVGFVVQAIQAEWSKPFREIFLENSGGAPRRLTAIEDAKRMLLRRNVASYRQVTTYVWRFDLWSPNGPRIFTG